MPKKKKQQKPPPPPKKTTALVAKFVPPWESGVPGPKVEMVEENVSEPYDWSHISERVKILRQKFVLEYLKDFNGQDAILRMGFKFTGYKTAAETASRWLAEPYTKFCFDRALEEVKVDAFLNRSRVIAGLLREANAEDSLCANSASRIAAWGKLAKILGLEITKVETDVKVSGGVMIVPIAANPDDWEKQAVPAQTALKVHAVA